MNIALGAGFVERFIVNSSLDDSRSMVVDSAFGADMYDDLVITEVGVRHAP